MPAAIEADFSKKHLTNKEKNDKKSAKASVTPSVKLKIPSCIHNDVSLFRIWKQTMKLYDGTELLNALDTNLLVRYCEETLAREHLIKLRNQKQNVTALLDRSIDKLREIVEDNSIKDNIGEENFTSILRIITIGMERFGVDTMLKIETRIESKTKLLNQMELSLYMTPRARAGAVPQKPDKEAKDDDPNAKMFN